MVLIRNRAIIGLLAIAVLALALPAGGAVAGKGQNGLYEGEGVKTGGGANKLDIRFRVAKGGARIVKWQVAMFVVCAGTPLPVVYTKQPMPPMKVGRKGGFRSLIKRKQDGSKVRIEVRGKLVGKKVKKGTLSYKVGFCRRGANEPVRWRAKRVGR